MIGYVLKTPEGKFLLKKQYGGLLEDDISKATVFRRRCDASNSKNAKSSRKDMEVVPVRVTVEITEEPKKSNSKRIVGSFENEFGVVNPGDKVLFVATSWKNTRLRVGTYIGYVERYDYYSKKTKKIPQVQTEGSRYGYWDKVSGKNVSWNAYYKDKSNYESGYRPVTYIATLDLARVAPMNEKALESAIKLV